MVCFVISLVGFWPSYVDPLATGTYRSHSPLMPWHVLCTALWLVLIISQPWLIQLNRVELHRRFGLFGVLVAVGVVISSSSERGLMEKRLGQYLEEDNQKQRAE